MASPDGSEKKTLTVGRACRRSAERLAAAGVPSSRLDARLLVAEALGLEPQQVFSRPECPVGDDEAARLEALVVRRAQREPMSHVLGRRGFWTLTLKVTADTLDPRPDTETVVEALLAQLGERGRPWRLLDLGTGTGCILLALLSELPNATGLGVDKSPAALEVARENALALGLAGRAGFKLGDWGRDIDECFDAITSNPPYIPDVDIAGLEPEVAGFEPRLALAGGGDGLSCYRALAPDVARLLVPGGVAALEVGRGQAAAVTAILGDAGLTLRAVQRDLGGVERCVVAHRA
jgi:release factor glutamine methyltransferase